MWAWPCSWQTKAAVPNSTDLYFTQDNVWGPLPKKDIFKTLVTKSDKAFSLCRQQCSRYDKPSSVYGPHTYRYVRRSVSGCRKRAIVWGAAEESLWRNDATLVAPTMCLAITPFSMSSSRPYGVVIPFGRCRMQARNVTLFCPIFGHARIGKYMSPFSHVVDFALFLSEGSFSSSFIVCCSYIVFCYFTCFSWSCWGASDTRLAVSHLLSFRTNCGYKY